MEVVVKTIFLIPMLALTLVACDRQDKSSSPVSVGIDHDNTGKNIRDRNSMTKTPLDQSESEADRAITQKIRQALISDDALTTNAKNIKIMTINGVVTIRGPVANVQEREVIARKVSEVQGVLKLDNQLEVTRNNH